MEQKAKSLEKITTITKEQAQKLGEGFKVVAIKMRDANGGSCFLDKPKWGEEMEVWDQQNKDSVDKSVEAQLQEAMPEVRFPANMLKCQALAREVIFSSIEIIEKLTLVQTMYLHGQVVESLHFPFPFVMPNTTNSWEQTIVADSENMLPAEVLSGNLVCVTQFKAYDKVIHESCYRIFYD